MDLRPDDKADPRTDSDWFTTLAESAWFAVFVYKRDHPDERDHFVYANPACARLTGYEIPELLGMSVADLLPADHRSLFPDLEKDFTELPFGHDPLEVKIVRRDGQELWVSFSAGDTTYDGSKAQIGIAVDVTARRAAVETLNTKLEYDNVLAEISHRFLRIEQNDLERGVERALQTICEAADVDRGALFELTSDGNGFAAVHRFDADNLPQDPGDLGGNELEKASWLMERLRRGEAVNIPRVAGLPKEARAVRTLFEERGVESLVCVPLFIGDRMQGMTVFSAVKTPASWGPEHLRLFHVGTEILGSAIHRIRAERDLRASREWLELAQRAGRSAAWEWHLTDDSLVFSTSTAEIFGVDPEHVPRTGAQLLQLIPEQDRERISDTFKRIFSTGEPYLLEHRIQIPDHGSVWVMVRGQVQRDRDGNVIRITGFSADISERKLAEQALRREKELAQVTLASIGDGVVRTDSEGCIDFLNPAAERLIGVTLHQVQQQPLSEIYRVVDENTGAARPNVVDRCLATRRIIEPAESPVLVRSDGSEFAVRESAAPIITQEGALVGAVLVFKDVSQLRGLQKRMIHLAAHDPLTGLINRREFEQRLAEAVSEAATSARQFVLCYLDLDEFKVVNDTCGHGAGDELLRQLTSVLATAVSAGDTLARLGGDEFGILFTDCTVDDARRQARTLLDAVRQYRFLWEDRVFEVGASIGIVPVVGEGGNLAELLSAADSACYIAKDRGRNQIHISQPDDSEIAVRHREMQWVETINRAIEDGRFRLFGQLICPIQQPSGPVYKEILLRLIDQEGEMILPSQFIPAAERFRMMPAIDKWVLEAALQAIGRLGKSESDATRAFTINLSGQSLVNPELLELIVKGLDRNGVPPSKVLFEITETAAISNLSVACDLIRELREKGCRFILDDFGSGLSSFRYLKNLAVDFLKIDGELVRNIAQDPIQREMVAAIHRIGASMGIRTIGEWVESSEVENELRDIGVDYAQGFSVARPVPFGAVSS